MKRSALTALGFTTLLCGCANSSLTPQNNSHFPVNSQPPGATVFVMAEAIGTTPLELSSSQVFPVTYPMALQDKYGKIEMTFPGCRPYEKTVSNSVVAKGLNAKLECGEQMTPDNKAAALPSSPPPATADIQERLRKLKDIFDEGLISKDEYDIKRQSILQDL